MLNREHNRIGGTGFEPVTSSVSRKRSTPEPTAIVPQVIILLWQLPVKKAGGNQERGGHGVLRPPRGTVFVRPPSGYPNVAHGDLLVQCLQRWWALGPA